MRTSHSDLSSEMTTDASALRRGSYIPVFNVPEALARVGQRRDALSLHHPALRVEVVAEVEKHDRDFFRDRLEHWRVELATRCLVERPARGLEVSVDRQCRVPGEVVTGIVDLGRVEERVDLGGRRIIKQKEKHFDRTMTLQTVEGLAKWSRYHRDVHA